MHTTSALNCIARQRKNERGAALLTTLLVSMLLLAAGGALIVSTSMTTANTFDSTAEAQAYYAAEAGLQATLDVLHGHRTSISPTTLTMDFRKAITLGSPYTANRSGDPSTVSRLSNWLVYDVNGTYTSANSRVAVGNYSFSIQVSDPDNTPVANGQPNRLLITSTGYGPKGAIKKLEAFVGKSAISFDPPATIVLAGGSPTTFSLGSSAVVGYSGNDFAVPPQAGKPTVAVSSGNVTTAQGVINGLNGISGTAAPANCGSNQVTPCIAAPLTSSNTPGFLSSADSARAFLVQLKALAVQQGRYFTSQPANLGTISAPLFTFVDNYATGTAVTLGPGLQGVGLLVATGDVNTNGNTDFKGIILALGSGSFTRSGGGNGLISGSVVVAKFDDIYNPLNTTTGFGAPTFTVAGGGNSNLDYNSTDIANALNSTGHVTIGVIER